MIGSAVFEDPSAQVRQVEIAKQNAEIRQQRIQSAEEAVPLLVETGLVIKVEPANYRAYVNEFYWAQHTIDDKRNAAAALGYYIQSKNGDTLGIDIYGVTSGRKLGEWSDKNGFRTE